MLHGIVLLDACAEHAKFDGNSTCAASDIHLVDPASSHMLVSKIKPCMFLCKLLHGETVNGSLKQL